jgi:EAL domain-containing protein (putative c-di-GMP-specific phosphodiesterase class I)
MDAPARTAPAPEAVAARPGPADQLRAALDRGELYLRYQPQVEVATRRVVRVEAFLAWHHPTAGPLTFRQFAPAAQEPGLLGAIGEWAIREACREAARWMGTYGGRLAVSVNVAGAQIVHSGFQYVVRGALTEAGLPAELLCLEVSDSAVTGADSQTLHGLHELHAQGVRFAIDDFGTGATAHMRLVRFPVDQLKVDERFVARLGEDERAEQVLAAVVGLAHSMGAVAVAECVETEAQHEVLRAHDCDLAQGNLYCEPGDATALAAYLRRIRF